jgi:para-aminobenzoate synthetase/4-amino-4-deoxychorismate lyase
VIHPARFDSLAAHGRSVAFTDPRGESSASRVEQVIPALREVEAAVSAGLHAAGFIAYEAAPAFDAALSAHPGRSDLPLVWFGFYAHRVEAGPPGTGSPPSSGPPSAVGRWTPSISPAQHARRVEVVRELIAAGDTYQVNLTFQLSAGFDGDPAALYAAVCRTQRAAYCAHLRGPFGSIISASPELFFRWAGRELEMRPMKGTRPRGRWPEEDQALARELVASTKDRAENLMIVDLLRNDAGRVAEPGSVSVPELFRLERYPTVHQLTSTVRGRTRPETTLTDLIRAVFPSGSVTGAPKVRTMQIIRELEDGPRGVYTGAIGFVSPGEAVFNVPIRTLLLNGAGALEMGVGSGITADSNAAAELAECMQKAAFVHERAHPVELLETMRHDPGTGFHLLDGHLRRLVSSADYFGYPVDPARVREALRAAVRSASPLPGGASGSPLRVRLLLGPAGDLKVECSPLVPRPSTLRARIARSPVDTRDRYLYHKTTAREVHESRLASAPGFDEVLLVNERGELTEFTTGNLVIVLDGTAVTPPVTSGLLPGVARAGLIEAGELIERVLTPGDLAGAEAVYLVSSVRNRIPVQVET